ncbi:hypothetical protein [Spirosoma sp.]|uniref:hypothetical protein n=1 Tax=Spirosoma sp. TaxID=1899569 RepID=UPI003B3BA378
MDELDKNIPEDFWRKAFDEAAETPPARVWSSIERQLDESNGPRIVPLWGPGMASSRPAIWWATGVAATLALLLVGWWAMDMSSNTPNLTSIHPSADNVAAAPATSANSSVAKSSGQDTRLPNTSTGKPFRESSPQALVASAQKPTEKFSSPEKTYATRTRLLPGSQIAYSPEEKQRFTNSKSPVQSSIAISALATSPVMAAPAGSTSFSSEKYVAVSDITSNQANVAAIDQLTGKPLRLRSPGPIQRIVWFQPAELSLEPEFTKEKRKSKEKWASVSVVPGAFNPSVALRPTQAAYANALVGAPNNANQSSVNSRSNLSVAYQAGAGVQLNEHWSVESGVGYLAGHSTVEAPTQSISAAFVQGASADKSASIVNNLYVDALRNSATNRASGSPATLDYLSNNNGYVSQTVYSSQARQVLSNDYQYMQVPVQVGYQLRPRKRLNLAVLGGLVTNIFVRNTVGNDVVITAQDGIYRPVSLAATMGARVRYRPSGRWSASLAGMYQPSLGSVTQSESQVQSHPTSSGMSFGLDYHF